MNVRPSRRAPLVLAIALALPAQAAHADFLDDAKGSILARNLYFNRDFREQGATQSKREEWGQGFILNMQSGYTDGTIGFGADVYGALGMRLDSSDANAGSWMFPNRYGDVGPTSFAKAGLALKAKIAKTEIKAGNGLTPKIPVLLASDIRLLPQTFSGAMLSSQDIEGLTLQGGRFGSVTNFGSTDHEDFQVFGYSGTSSRFDYLGAQYQVMPTAVASVWQGTLENIYRQNAVNWVQSIQLDDIKLSANAVYFDSKDEGQANAGRLHNRMTSLLVGAAKQGHSIKLGYQNSAGDAFPYLYQSDAYIANTIQILDFARADERSWQARYDLDFAAYGVPGLVFFTRYVAGDNFKVAGDSAGREWERDIDINYTIQSGPLKNLNLRWRNAMVRTNASIGDLDENRLVFAYTIPL